MDESKDKQKAGGNVPHASGTDAAPIGATSDEVRAENSGLAELGPNRVSVQQRFNRLPNR